MMHHWQGWLYAAAVLIPLAAFLVQILGLKALGARAAWLAMAAIAASFGLSVAGLIVYFGETGWGGHGEPAGHEPLAWTGSWAWATLGQGMNGGSLVLPVSLRIDGLAALLFVMVTGIATLINVYSISYMRGDARYPLFFAYLSLFCFSMLGLVASGSIFFVFVFWELVGVCSYLLIGFWYEEKANSNAAIKAFVVNRVGDVGMLVGLGLLWAFAGTFDIQEINHALATHGARQFDELGRITREAASAGLAVDLAGATRTIPYGVLVAIGLGIFAGCVGKSAQFPLHVWLPDAMAGPTPVSALIHAATMVAAGVYLVGRFFPVFTAEVLLVIAYTGAITLFLGATIALVQSDYKKVLAYSTVSQLGFMMLGLGVGGWAAGLFHLMTHACFKALLFLGAGSVYHAVHTYDMARLGGLRKRMPITATTMLLATMAIAGVPLLSGFYSKDAILAAVIAFTQSQPGHGALLVAAVVGATLTALYMFRMWLLLFSGRPRLAAEHAHEGGRLLTWPLVALAVPTVALGWTFGILPLVGHPVLEGIIAAGAPSPIAEGAAVPALVASLVVATLGTCLALLAYGPAAIRLIDAPAVARLFRPVDAFLRHKWYIDELYTLLFVRPVLRLGRAAAAVDRGLIDGIVHATALLTLILSRLGGLFDQRAVDGLVGKAAEAVDRLGGLARRTQTGQIRGYLMGLSVAFVVLSIGFLLWTRG
jgi:proton-translocating NADH-quinone oxidoreductase chain L